MLHPEHEWRGDNAKPGRRRNHDAYNEDIEEQRDIENREPDDEVGSHEGEQPHTLCFEQQEKDEASYSQNTVKGDLPQPDAVQMPRGQIDKKTAKRPTKRSRREHHEQQHDKLEGAIELGAS